MARAIGDAAVKFVTKIFWPWFLKNIWPLIVKALIAFLTKRIEELSRFAEEAVHGNYQARTAKAEESATEAERRATEATSEAEREKQEAIAQVWRTVAEQFRDDNERLRRQLAELESVQQEALESDMQSMTPMLDANGSEISLAFGGLRTALPALPSGSGAEL
jgi:F0F1-type ATP synthase membrane subunit b/b'